MNEIRLTERLEGRIPPVKEEIPCTLRSYRPEDRSFILASWLKSMRDEGSFAKMTNDVYYARVTKRIELALRGFITVAHNPEDEEQIYGWICFMPQRVDYVYVKYTFRGLGIARRLFAASMPDTGLILATHTGRCFDAVKDRYRLVYDPGPLEVLG